MADTNNAGRNLAMEAVRVSEAAARAASVWMGRGDEESADQAAVDAMSKALKALSIDGTIRIGENNGSQLTVNEKVGDGKGPAVDVALMPVEGPTIVAKGEPNGLSVIALAEGGKFLNVPDLYMEKIAVGGGLPAGLVDLDNPPSENLKALSAAKGVPISDLVVCILDRPRHGEIIAQVREAGARIMLIVDGDVSGVVATVWPKSGIDLYCGIGGASQGVLSAAALACVGGQMQGRLVVRDNADRVKADDAGITDPAQKFDISDMAAGDITFAATGVTPGALLKGVNKTGAIAVTQSLVVRSKTGTLRYVDGYHQFGLAD
ncbi:MAG: class II fructose-bisphosphatase [Rhodospirillaceae bacterium]|jgi:fructose-1,6-bisphosphatase II / sedoheptulose-1,7-bisphosphatase|nr:class II fructose-bisphosphatase [Rhodospirillaceae bacterium]MBT5561848.1 class II fructose-bisphosphatase [Rhodospirillaceae bacterium]MBT6240962.1 class II fructose-bisphosphatase [Rhodospirillaceae bacterium]MBT7138141.1 class II fructose-bisphosphatase [Rhodospirillaceae bacterium]